MFLSLIKGRAGADGARGMPGEPGSKVKTTELNGGEIREIWLRVIHEDVVSLCVIIFTHRATEALMDFPGCLEKRATG